MRALVMPALLALALAAAPAAQATTVATGWVRNEVVTQQSCVAMAQAMGRDLGFEVQANDISVGLRGPDKQIIVVHCDAAPYIFFVASHDTKPADEVTALCDAVEARLSALIDALP